MERCGCRPARRAGHHPGGAGPHGRHPPGHRQPRGPRRTLLHRHAGEAGGRAGRGHRRTVRRAARRPLGRAEARPGGRGRPARTVVDRVGRRRRGTERAPEAQGPAETRDRGQAALRGLRCELDGTVEPLPTRRSTTSPRTARPRTPRPRTAPGRRSPRRRRRSGSAASGRARWRRRRRPSPSRRASPARCRSPLPRW